MSENNTVKEFIDDVRTILGDTSCSIPIKLLLTALNHSLSRLARVDGINTLFTYNETFELASINEDGTNSASWFLNDCDNTVFTDILNLNILDATGCRVNKLELCYLEYRDFMQCNYNPEQNSPGQPSIYTIQLINGRTKIIFDKPIDKPYAIDILYTAYHPRIKSVKDTFKIPYVYWDILSHAVSAIYHMEANDGALALRDVGEYDYYVAELREMLARQPESLPNRTFRRGWDQDLSNSRGTF